MDFQASAPYEALRSNRSDSCQEQFGCRGSLDAETYDESLVGQNEELVAKASVG